MKGLRGTHFENRVYLEHSVLLVGFWKYFEPRSNIEELVEIQEKTASPGAIWCTWCDPTRNGWGILPFKPRMLINFYAPKSSYRNPVLLVNHPRLIEKIESNLFSFKKKGEFHHPPRKKSAYCISITFLIYDGLFDSHCFLWTFDWPDRIWEVTSRKLGSNKRRK